jgi:hypothetical protein
MRCGDTGPLQQVALQLDVTPWALQARDAARDVTIAAMRRGLGLVVLLCAGTAAADQNDLDLAKLGTKLSDGTFVGDAVAFRALASQLGTVLAPHLLSPADTTGFSGFQLSADLQNTSIDQGAAYWRALQGPAPSSMNTVGFFARKGLWFPLPSFEAGVGAVHLLDSHIWAAQLYAKIALHEGYDGLPLPSIAVRGAVSRVMNQRDIDLTIASIDVSASKHIGIADTWSLDPYAGWDLLMIVPRSQVIDPTPNLDPLQMPSAAMNNFTFLDQQTIYRNKVFLGAKLKYDILELTLEGAITLAGSSIDDEAGTNTPCSPMTMTPNCDAKDTAALQRSLALNAGFEF